MKLNKYLKELGYEQYDLPGYYDPALEKDEKLYSTAGADCRNEEDEEGFCSYEFFNLADTLSLYIYSKLCYFRDYIASICTPGSLTSWNRDKLSEEERKIATDEAHEKWIEIINKICEAFKMKITGCREGYEGIDNEKIREGMQLFIEYYDCLWY